MPNHSIKQLHRTAIFHNKSLYTPAGQQTSAPACCICLDSYFGNVSKKNFATTILKRKTTGLVSTRAWPGRLQWFVDSGCFLQVQVVVGMFLSALCRLLCLPSEIDLLCVLHGTARQHKNLPGQLLGNCRQYAQWLQFAVSTVKPCNWTR